VYVCLCVYEYAYVCVCVCVCVGGMLFFTCVVDRLPWALLEVSSCTPLGSGPGVGRCVMERGQFRQLRIEDLSQFA